MAQKQPNYEQTITELEEIVTSIEQGELEIGQLSAKIKRAQKLLSIGREQLEKVKNDVKKILDDGKE